MPLKKIVGIKKVEEQIVANLSADYTAFHTNNRNALVTASIGFVSLMIVTLYISAQLISDMVGGLRKLTEALEEIGLSVSESAMSISAAAGDLSNRTESKATALEQSTAALREITDSVCTSASHASDAETLSSQSLKEVEVCSEIVTETTEL